MVPFCIHHKKSPSAGVPTHHNDTQEEQITWSERDELFALTRARRSRDGKRKHRRTEKERTENGRPKRNG